MAHVIFSKEDLIIEIATNGYEVVDTYYATEDGNVFTDSNACRNHAQSKKIAHYTISREEVEEMTFIND